MAFRRVLLLAALLAVDILAAEGVVFPPEADPATSGPATCLPGFTRRRSAMPPGGPAMENPLLVDRRQRSAKRSPWPWAPPALSG